MQIRVQVTSWVSAAGRHLEVGLADALLVGRGARVLELGDDVGRHGAQVHVRVLRAQALLDERVDGGGARGADAGERDDGGRVEERHVGGEQRHVGGRGLGAHRVGVGERAVAELVGEGDDGAERVPHHQLEAQRVQEDEFRTQNRVGRELEGRHEAD